MRNSDAPRFDNDAVLGLRRRIPTLADAGVRIVHDPGHVRLMRRRPSMLVGIVVAIIFCGSAIGLGLLIHHLSAGAGGTLAIWVTSAIALGIVGAITAVTIHQWRRSRQPLLVIGLLSPNITVPTCNRTIPRRQIRQVTRWVERHTSRNRTGRNSRGWIRLTLQVADAQGLPRELVVATEMLMPPISPTLSAEVAGEVARALSVPVREVDESPGAQA